MRRLPETVCALALILLVQQAQAQTGSVFAGPTTGSMKATERPVVRGYGASRWGIKKPVRCNRRANPHCHTH